MLRKYYKFFSPSYNFFDSLINSYLWLAKPSSFNDPFEFLFNLQNISDDNHQKMHRLKIVNYMDTFGVMCLSSDTNLNSSEHVLMWSHYADIHKGVLLGFDFDYNYDKQEDEHLLTIGNEQLVSRGVTYLPNHEYPIQINSMKDSDIDLMPPDDTKYLVNKILFSKAKH